MKTFFTLMSCLFVVVLANTSGVGQQPTRLDITLEGPWVLYQDQHFFNGTHAVNVLVAMAPYQDQNMRHHHHPPIFAAGDGYQVPKGITCVGFGSVCAPPHRPKQLSNDGYSAGTLLHVKSLTTPWDWIADADPSNYYVILPMPDSYSNDGVYEMHFGSQFDSTGTKYYGDVQGPRHSIGIQLHYKKAPGNLSLFQCSTNKPKLNASDCNIIVGKPVANSGTLIIEMKAPDENDACDPHVRRAYPQMLYLIDKRSLAGNNNINQNVGFIDPASQASGGVGDYGNGECRACDPQAPFNPVWCQGIEASEQPKLKTLGDIVNDLGNLKCSNADINGKTCLDDSQQKWIQLGALNHELDFLRKTPTPTLSQLAWDAQLLRFSANGIDETVAKLLSAKKSRNEIEPDNSEQQLITTLQTIAKQERQLAEEESTKNGSDCRAPMLLVSSN